jgi:hypothetical protein
MKKVVVLLTVLVLMLLISACGGDDLKDIPTVEAFNEKGVEQGWVVIPSASALSDEITVTHVASKGRLQVEFFILTTDRAAQDLFRSLRSILETELMGESNVSTETRGDNYESFKLVADYDYGTVSRIGNTVMFATAGIGDAEVIEMLLDALRF